MSKKQYAYGEKKKLVMDWIVRSAASDHYIAREVGCHVTYVQKLRREMEARAFDAPPAPMPEAAPADEVSAVLAAREATYGNFLQTAHTARGLKNLLRKYADMRGQVFLSDQVESLEMICTKLARIVNGNPDHRDNWLDIAGYAKLVADRLGEDAA